MVAPDFEENFLLYMERQELLFSCPSHAEAANHDYKKNT